MKGVAHSDGKGKHQCCAGLWSFVFCLSSNPLFCFYRMVGPQCSQQTFCTKQQQQQQLFLTNKLANTLAAVW